MEDAVAIVLAAGQGRRMHSKVAKQFIDLDGRPILYYSLQAFANVGVGRIILVTSEDNITYCKEEIVERYQIPRVAAIVAGGKERYHSVYYGLRAIGQANVVMIHDGARPLVDEAVISRCYEAAKRCGACVAGVPVKDTIKKVDANGAVIDTPERASLWQIQTPQSFQYDKIMAAYERMMEQEDAGITDDSMVMERYGDMVCHVVEGDYCNIKITTPEDLVVAEAYLSHR